MQKNSHRATDESAPPRYPAASTMNRAIGQRYEGPDLEGVQVSGIIIHVGNYDKFGKPATYVLMQENSIKTHTISADDLARHLEGVALCRSMENDRE